MDAVHSDLCSRWPPANVCLFLAFLLVEGGFHSELVSLDTALIDIILMRCIMCNERLQVPEISFKCSNIWPYISSMPEYVNLRLQMN